jgi:protein TonB
VKPLLAPPTPHIDAVADSPFPTPVDPTPPAPDSGTLAPADTAPSPLAYLTRTPVKYPRDALQRHEQGTVILRVLVGADGLPQSVEIEKSSGSRSLDQAARAAVEHWTFQPGTLNGVRAALWARVPIAFDLRQL